MENNNEGTHVELDKDLNTYNGNGNGSGNGDEKKNRLKRAWEKLIYMSNGEFSVTRIMMAISFIFSIALALAGIILYVVCDKTLPNNIYDYAFKLTGGGVLQYGLTKIVGEFNNYNNTKNGTIPEPSTPKIPDNV